MHSYHISVAGSDPAVKISAEDLTCAICRSIFVEPVLLPCGHGFCLSCFNGVITYNSLSCPCCRKRFGNWLRQASRNKSLINESLWSLVQLNFAKELEKENVRPSARTAKESEQGGEKLPSRCTDVHPTSANTATASSATENAATASAPTAGETTFLPHLSPTGEIRKEFELQYEAFQREQEKERQNELKITQEFIVRLLEEELTALKNKVPSSSPQENMLVANPGHTPYTLTSTKGVNNLSSIQSEVKKNVIQSLSNSKAITSSAIHHHNTGSNGNVVQSSSSSSTAVFLAQTSKSNLIKTLAVRLNRGTDIIKQSVHKAIISKIPQAFLSGSGNREVLTVPPTSTHREPNSSVNSTDSLRLEMCHFKPIRTVPTTPNKKCHEDTLRTPKAKRLVKMHMNKCNRRLSSDMKPSLLQQTFKQSPRKSAFYLVGTSPSHVHSSAHKCGPSSSIKTADRKTSCNSNLVEECEKHFTTRKNPVVLMKRITVSKSKTKATLEMPGRVVQANTKAEAPRRNGSFIDALQGLNNQKEHSNESKTFEEDRLEKLIKEQKRCEERIEQEKLDYEIAKKLQTQLNVELANPFERKNLRKRRSQIAYDEDLILLDSDSESAKQAGPSVPPTKKCRRTCGRILSFKETEDVGTSACKKPVASKVKCDKTSQQHLQPTSLRRSIRKTKPTNRYIV